jgi:hypothetical protein
MRNMYKIWPTATNGFFESADSKEQCAGKQIRLTPRDPIFLAV